MPKSYEQKLAELRAKPITINGATPEEIRTIRAALRLYRTRNAEKHTDHPNMGWGGRGPNCRRDGYSHYWMNNLNYRVQI